jgi:ATP-dependent Lon protease
MNPYPKAIKRLLREYVGEAYERELHRELTKLIRALLNGVTGKSAVVN